MNKPIIFTSIAVLAILGALFALRTPPKASGAFDGFAQCIADKGATFYGAFWCPHCRTQKEMFENSKKLPYVECSTPDARGQIAQCNDKKIETYPTWDFADGTRVKGTMSFEALAQKTGCPLPSGEIPAAPSSTPPMQIPQAAQ